MNCAIQVLPDHVIDQIAAGEVVERPASVVKELVENALDAGARRISVEIEGGGRSLVRVVDDGVGMTEAEARLALVRHATSKLRSIDDLVAIATMGFRGEALPSIAAVSRMTLTTRARGSEGPGVRVAVEGGRVLAVEEAGAPYGTQVEVKDLLWNVPARLKFLKGEVTEASHVGEVVSRLAMAYPEVHLRLVSRGRTAIEAPPAPGAGERVAAMVEEMFEARRVEGGVTVEAYLGAPDRAQSTARGMHFFVGRRWVRDRGLVHAVLQGYGELVPRGRYPSAVVYVGVDGGSVDVNVHPQKLEVRFSDPQAVYAAVRHAVREAAAAAPWVARGGQWSALAAVAEQRPFAAAAGRVSEVAREYSGRLIQARTAGLFERTMPYTSTQKPSPSPFTSTSTSTSTATLTSSLTATATATATVFSGLTYIGQLDRTYLVCEAEGEMVLIDQHAAHERVAFQRLREAYRERAVPRQRLLFPLTVELDARAAAVAEEQAAVLDAVGFEVQVFGERVFAVTSVPAELRAGQDPLAVLRQLVGELAEVGGSRALEERMDAVFATLACHSVVRAGDALAPQEVASLLSSLDAVDFRGHCPHGRPVLLRIQVDEIARRFGRT